MRPPPWANTHQLHSDRWLHTRPPDVFRAWRAGCCGEPVMSYLRINRPMSASAKREALAAAANEILRLRVCDVDPGTPDRRKSRRELKEKQRQKMLASGNLQPFGDGPSKARASDKGVYVIGAAGHPVKIGITASIESRLHTINTGSPVRLKVYLFLDVPPGCAREIEKICHFRLHDYRVNGEWFDLDWREAVDMVRKVTGEVTAVPKAA